MLIIGLSIPVVVVGLLFGWWNYTVFKLKHERAAWKTRTLERLAGLSLTNEDISQDLETLKRSRGLGERQEWTSDHVLLMTNDEYLVYAFHHGFNDGTVDHLFLAHGSDDHWYYSTYHFCNEMAMVSSDDPPGSIAEFTSRYAVREFDGKSDVCLQHTWRPK